jgi:hypothetical protein
LILENNAIRVKTKLIASIRGRKEREVASRNKHDLACTTCGKTWTFFHKV